MFNFVLFLNLSLKGGGPFKSLDGVGIDTITAKLVWTPVIQFENIIRFEKNVNYGRTRKFSLWHLANDSLGYNMMYMEKVQLTLRCPFHFHKFPFDFRWILIVTVKAARLSAIHY